MAPAPSFEGPNYQSTAVAACGGANGPVDAASLPPDGSYPYVSGDKSGKPVKLPGNQGYRDADGNRWQWDNKKQEWDVQHPDGSHTNVGENGEITHGADNFPSKPRPKNQPPQGPSVDPAVAGTAAGAVGIGGILWWIGKGLAPLCGPGAPACAIVF